MDGANRDRGIVWLGPFADFDFLEPAGRDWVRISICELADFGNRKRDLDGLLQKLVGSDNISHFVGGGGIFVQVRENLVNFVLGRQKAGIQHQLKILGAKKVVGSVKTLPLFLIEFFPKNKEFFSLVKRISPVLGVATDPLV